MMAAFDFAAARRAEQARLEESLSQLGALTGWGYDRTFEVIRRLAATTTDSAQTLTDWLIHHSSKGATIAVNEDRLSIEVHSA